MSNMTAYKLRDSESDRLTIEHNTYIDAVIIQDETAFFGCMDEDGELIIAEDVNCAPIPAPSNWYSLTED